MPCRIENLALLIGSNPLPNFIVAKMLKPKRIRGYYSAQTKIVWERLKESIQRDLQLKTTDFENVELSDPNDTRKIKNEALNLSYWHLNYTGGTKTMSAFIYHLFRESKGFETASYLDDHDPAKACLRFDNGTNEAVDVAIDMVTFASLHGFTPPTDSAHGSAEGGPSEKDALAIAEKVLSDEQLKNRVFLYSKDNRDNKDNSPVALVDKLVVNFRDFPKELPESWKEWLPVIGLPESWKELSSKKRERWSKFFSGTWLEEYVKGLLKPMNGNHFLDSGIHYFFPGDKASIFELDVVIIRKHRLYAISCTTDASVNLCKSKGFEILHRVRQLGGDMARAGLLCFLSDEECRNKIKKPIRKNWDAPTDIEVWGIDSLQSWHEDLKNGSIPAQLKEWLDKENN
ncbi:MAG: hypothetical protein HQM09_21680 [Candidatus Riflebacteria bacterium]|nr:hypothetical protein [Candidatus Riflebacteria bacterium]